MPNIFNHKIKEGINLTAQDINKGWKKYNKRMDNIIENAEIAAEIEAENKIRSKNSKLLTISIIGVATLLIIFMRVEQYPKSKNNISKKPTVEKEKFLRKKILPIRSQEGDLAFEMSGSVKNLTNKPSMSPNFALDNETVLKNKILKPDDIPKLAISKKTDNENDRKYYVQLGAFSIRNNAKKYAQKIESKGFKTAQFVRNIKSKQQQVLIGSFSNKLNIMAKQEELRASGLTSFIKKNNNNYALVLGPYKNTKESKQLIKKIEPLGFKPKIKEVLIYNKSYTVRVEGLATKTEAQKISKKLASHGFINSFIRS